MTLSEHAGTDETDADRPRHCSRRP